MNRLKSIFIAFYPLMLVGITGLAGLHLARGDDRLAWTGAALTAAPFLGVLAWVLASRAVARTSARFPLVIALALAGVAVSGYAVATGAPVQPLVLATVGAAGFLAYSLWYSTLGRTPSATLAVGKTLPDVRLTHADGRVVQTASFIGRPTLMFFFRGNWCPLCSAQLKELVARYRELEQLGVRVALVSPQPHANTVALAARFDVRFDFFTDPGNRAAQALAIDMKDGLPMGFEVLGYDRDTVFPTVIILDADNVIRWVDQTDNYRVRPEPDSFLPFLRELAAARAVAA